MRMLVFFLLVASLAPARQGKPAPDEYLHNPPNLAAQWDAARKLLDENGFKNVKYALVAGVGHSNFPKEVLDHRRPTCGRP